MRFRETKESLPQIAKQLNVDAVVEGSVARSGSRVRITAQLIEAKSDRHMWAKSYERNLQDVLTLQDELARDIADEVRAKLTPSEETRLSSASTVNPEAHEDYLRGRYFWNLRTEEDLGKARSYFERATQRDPAYAPAYSGLADTFFYLGLRVGAFAASRSDAYGQGRGNEGARTGSKLGRRPRVPRSHQDGV